MLLCLSAIISTILASPLHGLDLHLFKREGISFSHSNASSWAVDFPTCAVKAGEIQSPIDFQPQFGTKDYHQLKWANNLGNTEFSDDGHGLQVKVPSESSFSLTNKGLEYKMVGIHFHSQSEHLENGKRYDLEIHFVHKSADGQLAVQGIWFAVGDKESEFLKSVLKNGVPKEKGSLALESVDFTPLISDLRDNSSNQWAYRGSLTTPPCTYGVQWTVSRKIQSMTADQFALIRSVKSMQGNFRPAQPVSRTTDKCRVY